MPECKIVLGYPSRGLNGEDDNGNILIGDVRRLNIDSWCHQEFLNSIKSIVEIFVNRMNLKVRNLKVYYGYYS